MSLQTSDTSKRVRPKTKRRGNNEGSIYQRSTGRWEAVLTVGFNEHGKRIRKTIYGWTKAAVQEELTKLQSAKANGTVTAPSRQNVAAFLKTWLEDSARTTVKDTTYENYRGIVDNHIVPAIGGVVLAKLTPGQVQGLYATMERANGSAYTIRLAHAVLRRALKQAARWGMVGRNVCDLVDPPRLPDPEIQPLDSEQVASLLDAARGDRLEALYILAVSTGLRLGELFALAWTDIDLKGKALNVRHTQTELKGVVAIREPKTAKSRRRVDLPDIAVKALEGHRKRALKAGHAGAARVFCNLGGDPMRRSHFHRADFQPLLKAAGLPPTKFHNLRHTHASLLLLAGVNPKIVSERLGHSSIGVTMDTYSHVLPTMQLEAAGKINDLLKARLKRSKKAAIA